MSTQAISLTSRYCPTTLDSFAGLSKPKAALARLVASPMSSAWIFFGPSGTGKTSMARALASALNYRVEFVGSQNCDLDAVRRMELDALHYPPMGFSGRLYLIDEADCMTRAAQVSFLSILDAIPADTIFVFTSNDVDGLDDRFRSRTHELKFSSEGLATPAAQLLESVWLSEMGETAPRPNFARIVKDARTNIRAALMALETEMLLA